MHNVDTISVIVPVYNTKPWQLDRAIESLLHQTVDNLEIILIDDGSESLETLRCLEKWNSLGIMVLRQTNQGLGAARNNAFRQSHGAFIGYLDSDDWVDSNFYEVLYSRCVNDESDIACAGQIREENSKSIKMHVPKFGVENTLYGKFQRIKDGSCCTKLFRRTIVEHVEYPYGYFFEDNAMLAELLILCDKVSYDNQVFYHYYSNPSSITQNAKLSHQRETDGIVIMAFIKGLSRSLPEKEGKLLVSKFMNILLLQQKYENDKFYRMVIDTVFPKKIEIRKNLSFIEKLFSVVNASDKRYKQITILGIPFHIRRKNKTGKSIYDR